MELDAEEKLGGFNEPEEDEEDHHSVELKSLRVATCVASPLGCCCCILVVIGAMVGFGFYAVLNRVCLSFNFSDFKVINSDISNEVIQVSLATEYRYSSLDKGSSRRRMLLDEMVDNEVRRRMPSEIYGVTLWSSSDFYYRAIASVYLNVFYYSKQTNNILSKELLALCHAIEKGIKDYDGYHDHALIYKETNEDLKTLLQQTSALYLEAAPGSFLNYVYPSVIAGNYIFDGNGDKLTLVGDDIEETIRTYKDVGDLTEFFDFSFDFINVSSKYLAAIYPFGYQNETETRDELIAWVVSYKESFFDKLGTAVTNDIGMAVTDSKGVILENELYFYLDDDLQLAIWSLLVIYVVVYCYCRSLYITTFGLMGVIAAFIPCFAVFEMVWGESFNLVNMVALWVILGIGCDDICVFISSYRRAPLETIAGDIIPNHLRLAFAYREAGGAMFVTSFTTSCSFFSLCLSSINPLPQFGWFLGSLVLANFIMVMSWFPSVLQSYVWFVMATMKCRCFVKKCNKCLAVPVPLPSKYNAKQDMKAMGRQQSVKVLKRSSINKSGPVSPEMFAGAAAPFDEGADNNDSPHQHHAHQPSRQLVKQLSKRLDSQRKGSSAAEAQFGDCTNLYFIIMRRGLGVTLITVVFILTCVFTYTATLITLPTETAKLLPDNTNWGQVNTAISQMDIDESQYSGYSTSSGDSTGAIAVVQTANPTKNPTAPTTPKPTKVPTEPTKAPITLSPSQQPTTATPTTPKTAEPSINPSPKPTPIPTDSPEEVPTTSPTLKPTDTPSIPPTLKPTPNPSAPTSLPTATPIRSPTDSPLQPEDPTSAPTQPTLSPSPAPSSITSLPTQYPSRNPSPSPTNNPSPLPTSLTIAPSGTPSLAPTSAQPTSVPSSDPSQAPVTINPTPAPSRHPTTQPTSPSNNPSTIPTTIPTQAPTFALPVGSTFQCINEDTVYEQIETGGTIKCKIGTLRSSGAFSGTLLDENNDDTYLDGSQIAFVFEGGGLYGEQTITGCTVQNGESIYYDPTAYISLTGDDVLWCFDEASISVDSLAVKSLEYHITAPFVMVSPGWMRLGVFLYFNGSWNHITNDEGTLWYNYTIVAGYEAAQQTLSVDESVKITLFFGTEYVSEFVTDCEGEVTSGTLTFDKHFSIYSSKSQSRWLDLCDELNKIEDDIMYRRDEDQEYCFSRLFNEYLNKSSISMPMPLTNDTLFNEYISAFVGSKNSGGFSSIVYDPRDFDGWFGTRTSAAWFASNASIGWVQQVIRTQMNQNWGGPALYEYYLKWNEFITDFNAGSPSSFQGIQTSGNYIRMEVEVAFLDGFIQSVAYTILLCSIVMVFFTQNLYLVVLVCLYILIICIWVVGLFGALKWPFGIIEIISVPTVVGLTIDYALHITHAYIHSPYPDRLRRAQSAVNDLGSSVFASAMTTISSMVILYFATIIIFSDLGWVVGSTTSFGVALALCVCPPCLMLTGPERDQCHFTWCCPPHINGIKCGKHSFCSNEWHGKKRKISKYQEKTVELEAPLTKKDIDIMNEPGAGAAATPIEHITNETNETDDDDDDDLPEGWKAVLTEDGKIYYQNDVTHQTQWKKPLAVVAAPIAPAFAAPSTPPVPSAPSVLDGDEHIADGVRPTTSPKIESEHVQSAEATSESQEEANDNQPMFTPVQQRETNDASNDIAAPLVSTKGMNMDELIDENIDDVDDDNDNKKDGDDPDLYKKILEEQANIMQQLESAQNNANILLGDDDDEVVPPAPAAPSSIQEIQSNHALLEEAWTTPKSEPHQNNDNDEIDVELEISVSLDYDPEQQT